MPRWTLLVSGVTVTTNDSYFISCGVKNIKECKVEQNVRSTFPVVGSRVICRAHFTAVTQVVQSPPNRPPLGNWSKFYRPDDLAIIQWRVSKTDGSATTMSSSSYNVVSWTCFLCLRFCFQSLSSDSYWLSSSCIFCTSWSISNFPFSFYITKAYTIYTGLAIVILKI